MARNKRLPMGSAQSRALAITSALTAVVFWRPGLDVFGYPKFAVMVLGVAVALVVATHRAATTGRLIAPTGAPVWLLVGFSVTLVLATLASDTPLLSFLGPHSRHSGGLFYLAAVLGTVLLLQVAAHEPTWRWEMSRTLAVGFLWGAGLVSLYGIVQLVGLDPFDWLMAENERVGESRTSTFGNPNFTAAFLGSALPVAAWAVWDKAHATLVRVAGGTVAVGLVAVVIGNRSVQGPIAAATGLLVFIVAALLEVESDRLRRVGAAVTASTAAIAAGVTGAGLAGAGPLSGLVAAANVELRMYYWAAGMRMFADHPITGVGLDRYGAHFGAARSPEAAKRLGLDFLVDAAHNVVIQLFATGGILVGGLYVAFVGVTAWALVRGFRRTAGRPRLLLGALGGVWLAYQAQSLVSIDTPPLLLMHWLTAGAILSWSGLISATSVDLPWVTSRGRREREFHRRLSGAVLSVVLLALAVLLSVPLRASTEAARGMAYADAGQPDEAIDRLKRAAERTSWDPTYWQLAGRVALDAGQMDEASQAYEQALARDPRSVVALVTAARLAEYHEQFGHAQELYERALAVDPQAPALLKEAADFHESHGDPSRAASLSARAEQIDR